MFRCPGNENAPERAIPMSRFFNALIVLGWSTHSGFADNQEQAKKADANKIPPAFVQLLKGSADDFIKKFDKNKDGFLSKDELPPALAKVFDKFDTDGNGKLDKKEVEQMLQVLRKRFGQEEKKPAVNSQQVDKAVARLLEQMDTDKDGKISRAEAKGRIAELFDQLDTNKNGFLDKNELRQAAMRLLAAQAAQGSKGAQPPKPAAITGPEFDDLDKNADGRLTKDELQGTPFGDHFDEIDTNKDGKIDRKEFEAYLKKLAAKEAEKKEADKNEEKKPVKAPKQ
jgi:Ca2+-binding EF-hand superfamily protein